MWEESAEISGPRRRAWRKLPQLVMTRSVAVDSSHTMWGFPGRKNVRTFWSCVLTSLAPGMTNNASSRAAKADGFSTGPWLGWGSDWGKLTTERTKLAHMGGHLPQGRQVLTNIPQETKKPLSSLRAWPTCCTGHGTGHVPGRSGRLVTAWPVVRLR